MAALMKRNKMYGSNMCKHRKSWKSYHMILRMRSWPSILGKGCIQIKDTFTCPPAWSFYSSANWFQFDAHQELFITRIFTGTYNYLVGGWATSLKNMSSSIGMMTLTLYINGKIKFMATKPPTSNCESSRTEMGHSQRFFGAQQEFPSPLPNLSR